MKGNAKLIPSPIRMPQSLKDWLKHQAIDNRRSLNSEILARLEESQRRESRGAGVATEA